MAIAIGTGTGNVQTGGTAAGTSVSVNTPTDAVTNDLLIAAVTCHVAKTLTATGWTSIATVAQTTGGDIEVFRRLHDGSSGSYSFSWSGVTTAAAGIVLVTGADTSSPVDVSATYDSAFTSSSANTAPSVTTTVANTLLLNFYFASGSYTWTPASSQTEVFDRSDSGVISMEMTKLAVAGTGATGTKTSTASANAYWGSVSVAIKPFTSPIKSISGVPYASVKKVSGVPIAQVKKIAGVG